MNRLTALFKLFLRMFVYGIVLGGIAGALVLITITVTNAPTDGIISSIAQNNILDTTFLSVMWGGIFGCIFGGNTGFYSGIVMAVVTSIGYGTVRNPRNFKIVMGTITAVITSGVFLVGGLWDLGAGEAGDLTWASAMVMSVVIAVYASQITARKYVNEMSVHKVKAKAR